MLRYITQDKKLPSIPIVPVNKKTFKEWLKEQPKNDMAWVQNAGFTGDAGTFCLVPNDSGGIKRVLAGVAVKPDLWSFASLPSQLPSQHIYHLAGTMSREDATHYALGWVLATYVFDRYRKSVKKFATLRLPAECHAEYVTHMAESIFMIRTMINTPTNDMGPSALAKQCQTVAKEIGAECKIIVGDDLLKQNYPLIHAVGKASADAPRLIDIRWGNPAHRKLTLVGKGVCFDSGGLDIKNASNMKLMKKDMGGAAHVLGLARLIALAELPINLRVLIPAVENSISSNAFRPLDIIKSRKGLTVEIGNTDAEGRLILCDALAEADSEEPEMIIDFATLTGAARTALGTDIPAFFSKDDPPAGALLKHSRELQDPVWRLPLYTPYREMLNSPIADLNSAPDSGYAGAITAALYLKEFVTRTKSWIHIDLMAWNTTNRPGRPTGGEAMALRSVFAFLRERYAA